MSEAALVSIVAMLAWLVLIWRSGALRNISSHRKMIFAAVWISIFAIIALVFRSAT
ncbi:hypothetical protein [Croceibacterium mercuriale]|uniref:hypothetical protein n=1 Tax=Croceibacterium mercuriale TaxID=1572751 RepID=UPI000AD6A45D|nr:hypothetical protein [Croceibacterium mercuriale]